jgi:hypothetical protein
MSVFAEDGPRISEAGGSHIYTGGPRWCEFHYSIDSGVHDEGAPTFDLTYALALKVPCKVKSVPELVAVNYLHINLTSVKATQNQDCRLMLSLEASLWSKKRSGGCLHSTPHTLAV